MNTDNTELLASLESEIVTLHETVAAKLDDLKANVIETATLGANLGDYVEQWIKAYKLKTPEEVTNCLRAFGLRDDVTRFAKRASSARKRGMLDDPSQLQFALADTQAQADKGQGQRHEANEVMRTMSQCGRMRQFFDEWTKREPVETWDDVVRQSVREQLQPMVELYGRLQA